MHERVRKIRLLRRLKRRARLFKFARNERGVQLAEAAIIIPIFILLFAATAEFGRYFHEYTTLAKAARMGARYMVTSKLNLDDPQVKNLVVYGNTAGTGSPVVNGLTADNVVITARDLNGTKQTAGVPATITVEISGYTHTPLFNLGALLKSSTFSMAIPVKPSVTMRYLLTTPLV